MDNPWDMGRQMMIAWEKSMGDMLERMTRDENFIRNMSQAVSSSLDVRKKMDQRLQDNLESLNVPTRDDIKRVLDYCLRIEQRLLDLEEAQAEMLDRLAKLSPVEAADPVTADGRAKKTVKARKAAKPPEVTKTTKAWVARKSPAAKKAAPSRKGSGK